MWAADRVGGGNVGLAMDGTAGAFTLSADWNQISGDFSVLANANISLTAPTSMVLKSDILFVDTAAATVMHLTTAGLTVQRPLALQDTLSLGASTLAANGSVATVLGSVGPAGSHTTVQEWVKVKGSGGVDRWAPLF
jgi:hypothetical protein